MAGDGDLALFAHMFEICPVPLLLAAGDGRILMTNAELDRLFCYPPGGLPGLGVDILVPAHLRQVHSGMRETFLSAPIKRPMGGGLDLSGVTRSGALRRLELGLAPVSVDGQTCVLVTVVDVSVRQAVEAELERRSVELEALNTDLKQIARSASHDLKTPLTSICGLLSLAIDEIDDGNLDEIRSILRETLAIGRRGTRLIETVLDLTRAPPVAAEHFSLRDVIDDQWAKLTAELSRPPDFVVELRDGDMVETDRRTLEMMLGQLLSNACRFGDPGKTVQQVRLTSQRQEDRLQISVADNGIGVDESCQHRVFRAFDRLHANSGNGIGLTLVRRAAERLGGAVSFWSRPGEGSVFTLSIPLQARVWT